MGSSIRKRQGALGVIRVGKAAARELLAAGDVLAVSIDATGVVSLD
jgi:hypothetical protein